MKPDQTAWCQWERCRMSLTNLQYHSWASALETYECALRSPNLPTRVVKATYTQDRVGLEARSCCAEKMGGQLHRDGSHAGGRLRRVRACASLLHPSDYDPSAAAIAISTSDDAPQLLYAAQPDLIEMAGLVARRIDAVEISGRGGDDSLSLVGLGISHGYSVTLPNSGGQWRYEFEKAELDVQIVGRSEEELAVLLHEATSRVADQMDELQDEQRVEESLRASVRRSPADPAVIMNAGRPTRAAGAALVLGFFVLLTLAMVDVEGWLLMGALRRRFTRGRPREREGNHLLPRPR